MFRNPTTDLLVVLFIVLLFFGPKRLPALGKHLGQGIREFKDSITGAKGDNEGEEPAQITEGSAGPGSEPVTVEQRPAEGVPSEPRS